LARWRGAFYATSECKSLDELKARILKGIEEINAAPVVHRWKNFEALAED
jgi:hypothetical protein